MIRFFTVFSFLLTVFSFNGYSQTVQTGTLDQGPYGQSSDIAVPVRLDESSGYFEIDNVFRLYISDASGNFAGEREIGSYAGFYTTFINGVIPASLPAGNYRVRVKSSSPATVSAPSASFEVRAATGVQAGISAPQTIKNGTVEAFGVCTPGKNNSRFNFTNTSSPGADVQAIVTNASDPADVKTLSFESSPQQFMAAITHYTIVVRAVMNGIAGTRAYFLINNLINTPFNPPGSSTVCLPLGALEYNVETSSSNGIQLNFPGNTYQVTWGDGSTETYNLNHIRANSGKVRHTYTRSSCGSQITIGSIRYYNVFGIVVQTRSPFCGDTGVPVSSQAKVVTQPENRFSLPEVTCLNTPLTVNNSSIAGDNPSAGSPSCQNNNVTYYWYVDNQQITPQGVPIGYQPAITFTTPGVHTVRLESESTSECQADPVEKTIYVQGPPVPAFDAPASVLCLGTPVKFTDKSVLDADPAATYSYEWVISGPAPIIFQNGTSVNSKEPELNFSAPGAYTVKLNISSACNTVSSEEQTLVINDKPAVTAAWETNICGKGHILTFSNTDGNPVKTTFAGTFNESDDTYHWTISGGNYAFENGTGASSKEPAIRFDDYATYTVSVSHTNHCGSETLTRQITFNESPAVSAGADQTVCAGSSVVLSGTITGPPALSYSWTGGTGTFIPGRDVLDPQYIPSAAEELSGKAELTLTVLTSNPAPCNKVEDVVIITVNPRNKITGAPTKTVCSGASVNYQPVAVVAGSTVTWTTSATANADGFSPSGSGPITDVLTNNDPLKNAVVTYTLTPEANGCPGEPFTLTVTVNPVPQVTANVPDATICTGQPAGITLSSGLAGTRYIWTSTITGLVKGNTMQKTPSAVSGITDILVNQGNTPASVTYTITPVNAAGCTGEPTTVTVNITAPPVTAFAGNDQKLCDVASAKLDAANPGEGTGKWTLVSGQSGISFDDDTRFDATVNGLRAGQTYRFRWTVSGPYTCTASTDEVEIAIFPEIGANTVSVQNPVICSGSVLIVAGSVPSGGDGSYHYSWESSSNGSDWQPIGTLAEKDLQIAADATTWFRRKVTSGNCYSYSNELKIEVQESISNNIISGDQQICSGSIPQAITGSQPSGADGIYTYQWQSSIDHGATWTSIASATEAGYQPPALSTTTLYRRLVSSAVCTGLQQNTSGSVTVTVSPGPVAHFTWTAETSCAPFVISDQTIRADASEQGDSYTWFAGDVQIGTGKRFPGYTLEHPDDSVEIKLEVNSTLGCGTAVFTHTFRSNASLNAGFTADKQQGCGPLTVNFSNITQDTQGVTFKWDFGNGKISSLMNPDAVTFENRTDGKDTIYTVTLRAISSCVTSEKTLDIKVTGHALAMFSPDRTSGCSPLTVTFRNNSPGSSNTYTWDFGDGSAPYRTTTKEPVTHTYISGKSQLYTVKMTAENECGKDESSYVVRLSPNTVYPDLVVNGNELEGCAPHTVRFINNTTGATLYTWDFGDGSAPYTTNSAAPVPHTYTMGGNYTIRLTASNGCSDTSTVETVTVHPQAETAFSADLTSGCTSLTVKFTNKTNGGASYAWDFGDGTTSASASPVHTYQHREAPYTVRLISTSPFGCTDTLEMKDLITVTPPPVADFDVLPGTVINIPDHRFTFRDASRGDIKSWNWDFGDRSSGSSLASPDHVYPDTGSYKVRLVVTNSQGCADTLVRTVRISGVPGALFIPNAFMPNSVSEELRTFRAKGSGLESWHMRVFNKWGEQIWQTDALDDRGTPAASWDGMMHGAPAPQGIYFWEISAKFKNGTDWPGMSYKGSEPKRTGAIHLIR